MSSIDAIAAFGVSLRNFEDLSTRALVSIEEQAKGALQWLEHDAPAYWRTQIRQRYDDVSSTRTALETCRMRQVGENRPACLEEIAAHRTAQRRLHEAEEKIEVVRRWAQKVREEVDEYRSRSARFRLAVERDVPRTLALIDRTVTTLDSYAERAAEAARSTEATSQAPESPDPGGRGEP